MDEHFALFALSRVPSVGPKRYRALINYFIKPSAVWLAATHDLTSAGILPLNAIESLKNTNLDLLRQEYNDIRKVGLELLMLSDAKYPSRLKRIADPPLCLYTQGDTSILDHSRSLAIVGTRRPSSYGLTLVDQVIEELLPYHPHIISGLAYGIDIAAHKGALHHGLPTTAVLANGLDKIYPALHKNIARQITSQGCLISEYPLGTMAEREFFPMRNRIVAGLADVVLVVESGKKGGSMITALLANQYQREVVTFPGKVASPMSHGPHHLIKSHQAHLVENAEDIIRLMRWENDGPTPKQMHLFEFESKEEELIHKLLDEKGSMHLDDLAYHSQISMGDLPFHLLQLEMNGRIKSLPGNQFALI